MIRFIQGHVTVNLETDIATTFMQTEEFEEIYDNVLRNL